MITRVYQRNVYDDNVGSATTIGVLVTARLTCPSIEGSCESHRELNKNCVKLRGLMTQLVDWSMVHQSIHQSIQKPIQ